MYVYPVNTNAKLPPEFVQYAQTAAQPATLDPGDIAANRDKWIADWTKAVLR
jgi:thiamine transport system substrate-binding protein